VEVKKTAMGFSHKKGDAGRLALALLSAFWFFAGTQAGRSQNLPSQSSTLRILKEKQKRDPQSFETNRNLAKWYLDRSKPALAVPFLERAQSAVESDFENTFDLAMVYLHTGEIGKARALAWRLLALRDSPEVHRLLGNIEDAAHSWKAAAGQYKIAAQTESNEQNVFDFARSLLRFDSDAAIKVFSFGVEKYPQSARLRVGLGVAQYLYGSYDKAAETLCLAVDLDPSDPQPLEFLGKLQNLSSPQRSEVDRRLSAFLKLHPQSAAVSYYLGRSRRNGQETQPSQKDLADAERLQRGAIRLNPRIADAYFELGQICEMQERKQEAVQWYERAVTRAPQLAEYRYRLAFAYRATGRMEEFKRTIGDFERLKAAEPTLASPDLPSSMPRR
jgi:tetratricopeptide (TPR) repeat protein